MKKVLILLSFALLILASCGKNKKMFNFGSDVKLSNDLDTVSYYIGLLEAQQEYQQLKGKLGRFEELKTIKMELIAKAFDKVFAGDSIKISYQELGQAIDKYIRKKRAVVSTKNTKEGQEFLAKNKKNSDVHVLPSGLQYKVIKDGTGPKPDSSSLVSVNYTGTLVNGEQFETTIGRQPFQTEVTQVIKGWTEALLRMNVGSKWKIFIPSELAYGENGSGKIQPGSTLIFEMELLSIDPKPVQPKGVMGQPNMGQPNARMQVNPRAQMPKK